MSGPEHQLEIKARLEEVKMLAMQNTSHVFHFLSEAALEKLSFRDKYKSACEALANVLSACIQDIIGIIVVGHVAD